MDKREEAINRLEILTQKGLMRCVLRDFKRNGTVYMSEYNGLCGALYYFNELGGAKDEWVELVKKFEEENNALVYHMTHEYTEFGELIDVFYVSNYEKEWADDREELKDNYTTAYVFNLSVPEYSAHGLIGYKALGGGLVRVI